MTCFVGLDVSQKMTAIGVVDNAGRRLRRGQCPTNPGPHEDVAKELARLREENEILRQEREILNKAAAFFAKEGSR
jgi:transposase-like protein